MDDGSGNPDHEHGRSEWMARLLVLAIIVVPVVVTVLARALTEPGAMDCSTFGMSC